MSDGLAAARPGAVHPQGDGAGPRGADDRRALLQRDVGERRAVVRVRLAALRLRLPRREHVRRFLIAAALGLPGAFLYAMLAADHAAHRRRLRLQQPLAAPVGRLRRQLQLLLLAGDHLRPLHDLHRHLRLRRLRPDDGRLHRLERLARLRRLVLAPTTRLFITGTVAVLISAARLRHRRRCASSCGCRSAPSRSTCSARSCIPVIVGLFQSRRPASSPTSTTTPRTSASTHASPALGASADEAGFAPHRIRHHDRP